MIKSKYQHHGQIRSSKYFYLYFITDKAEIQNTRRFKLFNKNVSTFKINMLQV